MAYQCFSLIIGKYIVKRSLMREPGVSILSGLILDENRIHMPNLRKSGISVGFDGGK